MPAALRQSQDNDCGLAALATIASHYGKPVDYGELVSEVELDDDGTDLLSLLLLARRLGFSAQGIKASYTALATCALPAIAHLRRPFGSGHFVVLHRWSAEHVLVADPTRGLRTVPRRRYCHDWSGYLLLVEPKK